jgi:hypothetical protein
VWLQIPAQCNDKLVRLDRERDRLGLALRHGSLEEDADRGEDGVPGVWIEVDLDPDAEIREVPFADSLVQHRPDALERFEELRAAEVESDYGTVDINEPIATRHCTPYLRQKLTDFFSGVARRIAEDEEAFRGRMEVMVGPAPSLPGSKAAR